MRVGIVASWSHHSSQVLQDMGQPGRSFCEVTSFMRCVHLRNAWSAGCFTIQALYGKRHSHHTGECWNPRLILADVRFGASWVDTWRSWQPLCVFIIPLAFISNRHILHSQQGWVRFAFPLFIELSSAQNRSTKDRPDFVWPQRRINATVASLMESSLHWGAYRRGETAHTTNTVPTIDRSRMCNWTDEKTRQSLRPSSNEDDRPLAALADHAIKKFAISFQLGLFDLHEPNPWVSIVRAAQQAT